MLSSIQAVYATTSIIPVKCTMDSGAGALTLTLSGGSPSPSPATVSCDGASHNITVQASTTITATEPAPPANTRYLFVNGFTTVTNASCGSGTCAQWTISNFVQLHNTFQDKALAQTLFDAGMSDSPFGCYLGSCFTQIVTITTTATSSDSSAGWSDYGHAVTFDQYLTGPPSGTRWQDSSGSTSNTGSITTGSNTFNASYYKQVNNSFKCVPDDPFKFDGTYACTATGSVLGTPAQSLCTGNTSNGGGTVTISTCWGDAGTVTLPTTFANGWHSETSGTFSLFAGGQTLKVNYTTALGGFGLSYCQAWPNQPTCQTTTSTQPPAQPSPFPWTLAALVLSSLFILLLVAARRRDDS